MTAGQFDHPAAQKLLDEIKQLFIGRGFYLDLRRPLIFLCGGKVSPRHRNMRSKFMRWAKGNFPSANLVLAESAYAHTKSYRPLDPINLSDFEKLIASIADCVLLFPESAGSFAELGLFSHPGKIQKKMLVAFDTCYQSDESFVVLGPIRTLDRKADLKPAVQLSGPRGSYDFSPIKKRLARFESRPAKKAFVYKPYSSLEPAEKIAVILQIIRTVSFVDQESLYQALRAVFGPVKTHTLKQYLSILVGSGYLREVDSLYVATDLEGFLRVGSPIEFERLKARIMLYYIRNQPDLLNAFRGIPHAGK
jgi:hypothetical protein